MVPRRVIFVSAALMLTAVVSVMATRTIDQPIKSPAVAASPTPTTRPTTSSSESPQLPSEFAVLAERNVFQHGPAITASKGPEASLVLKGVTNTGWFTAFVEDVNTKNVLQLRLGESVGRGKLKSVCLDSVDYECAGLCKHIEIGQNFNGEIIAPATQAAQVPPAPQPAPGDAPQGENPMPANGQPPPQMNRHRRG